MSELEEAAIAAEFAKAIEESPSENKEAEAAIPTSEEEVETKEAEVKIPDLPLIAESAVEKTVPVIEDENNPTFKKRWLSLDGMIKAEKLKREEAEQKLIELESRIKTAPAQQASIPENIDTLIDDAREEYEQAILEGLDKAEKSKLYRALRNLENQTAMRTTTMSLDENELQRQIEKHVSSRLLQREVESVVENSIKQYPFLDPNGDAPNHRAIAAIQIARKEYEEQGYSFSDAIAKAVEDEAPRYAAITPAIPVQSKGIDEQKLREMEVVKKKGGPVGTQQRGKAEPQSLEEAWAEIK